MTSRDSLKRAARAVGVALALVFLAVLLGYVMLAESAADLVFAMLVALAAAAAGFLVAWRVTPASEAAPVQGVTKRLRALDERLAAQRPEVELTSNRLQKVMGSLGDRLVLVDERLAVVGASPDAATWLGLGDRDLAGTRLPEAAGPNHPVTAIAHEAISRRRDVELRQLSLGGPGGRRILAAAQFVDDGGRPKAIISLRDAESMRRLEAHVDYATKLAQIGRIMSGVSHEIKNPLNAMAIHVEVLRSKLEAGNTDVAGQLDVLDAEIKRLDRVVKTFLDFARPVEARLESVDLNRVVEGVTRLSQAEAQSRGVRVVLQLASEPLPVRADADILTQALLNVVINGCQAMGPGGLLRVATLRSPDRWPRVEIEDSGVGIAPDARDKIFNLYYTTKEGGSGIGLAQTFRAVQIHNGRLDVASDVGRGTKFVIDMPEA